MNRWGLSILVTVLLISSGEAAGTGSPVHMHLLCPAAEGCPAAERHAIFDTWRQEALHAPGSTFVLWLVGPAHLPAAAVALCVPPQWGANVMAAKASFLTAAREAVQSGRSPTAVPSHCLPPSAQASGRHHLQVSTVLSPFSLGVWQRFAAGPEAPRPLHVAVLCDRSMSRGGTRICTPVELLAAFDYWLAESGAALGASLSVSVVGASRQPPAEIWTVTVPERSVGERVAWLLHVRYTLPQTLSTTADDMASALAEAVYTVGPPLRERPGRQRLVLLSDLLQYTPGAMHFEQRVPTEKAFLAWLQRQQLLPDLHQVEVLVCGADHRPGLRAAWSAAFRAMHATVLGITQTCTVALAPGGQTSATN